MGNKPIMRHERAAELAQRLLDSVPRDEHAKVSELALDQPSAVFADACHIDSIVANLAGDIMRGRTDAIEAMTSRIRGIIVDSTAFDSALKAILDEIKDQR